MTKITNNISSKVGKPENKVSTVISDNADIIGQELEAKAKLGLTSVKTKVSNLVEEKDFNSEVLKRNFHMFAIEREELYEIARNDNGLLSTEPIDILKELKLAAKKSDEKYASMELSDILLFLKSGKNYDYKAKDKILKFIREFPGKEAAAKAIRDLRIYKDCSPIVKNELLDLVIKLHDDFGEQIELLYDEFYSNKAMKMLGRYVKKDLSEAEQISRLKNLSKIIENTDDINPLQDLILSTEDTERELRPQMERLINKFIDSKIIPTKATVEVFQTSDLKLAEEFLESMKHITDLKLGFVGVDKYALENIIKAKYKAILNNIISLVKSEKNPKEIILKISENTLNPSEYGVSYTCGNKITNQIFNKKTNNPVLIEKTLMGEETIEVDARDCVHNNLIKQKLNSQIGLVTETIEHFDKNGKLIYKDLTIPSNIQGQYDVYRQMSNGKIKVIAKSFKDPITSEVKMTRNLTSPNGTKTKINYTESKDGSYTYDYEIKNKNGKIILDNHNKYTVIDENHFISEINEQEYDIVYSAGKLTVTPKWGKSVQLNLEEIVPSQDPQIINTIIHLPGNELINLNNLNIRINKHYENNNAVYAGKETTNWFNHFFYDEDKKVVNNINIGNDVKDSLSIILHEMGHIKLKSISESEWKDIIEVFQNELQTYRKQSAKTNQRLLNYLIDTDHYLNSGKGAIEEGISDLLAMKLIPHDKNLGDTAIRGLKFQENFPETTACVNKIFNKYFW